MIGHRWLGRRLTETWLTPIRHRRFRTDEVARLTGRNSIFLQPSSTTCNTVPVLLGTMKLMETKQRSVGYFRVIEHASRRPTETHTGLVEAVFDTGVQYGCTVEEAIRLVNKKDLETLNEMVANRFSEFRKDYDFVVVEGYNITNFSEELNNEINMNCANAIGASVVLVSDGRDNSSIAKSDDWRTKLRLLSERLLVLRQQNPDILGVILNRYPNAAPDFDLEKANVEKATKVPILGSIPLDGYLRSIMFRDILEGLGANLVFGEGKAMDVPLLLEDLRIVSERIDTMIDRVENNPLVAIGRSRAELKKLITEQISKEPDHRLPNDRVAEVVRLLHPTFSEDMIIAMVDQIDADRDGFVIESDLEGTPPKFLLITAKDRVDIVLTITSLSATRKYGGVLGGVILSGKSSSEITERTLEAISDTPALKALVKVPILETDLEPLELVDRLEQLPTKVTANSGKVERSIKLFNENVNTGKLLSGVQNPLEHISVKMFLHQVSSLARQKEAHIVVPEVNDDRILLAADEVRRRQLARLTLLGDVDAINLRIASLGLQSRDVEIVDPHKSHKFDEYAEIFDKSLYRQTTPKEIAGEALLDPYWYGAMMVKNGDADGFVGGINRPTRGTVCVMLASCRYTQVKNYICCENLKPFVSAFVLFSDSIVEEVDVETRKGPDLRFLHVPG
mmetsp:Transcript_19957/g.79899  ORF Transcript_19957/g.79899 Transcript_19957/m.79899 type:complete len:680 (-) Transcript_19957:1392-3431(-)